MKTMIFVSRHNPTEDQLILARERGFNLVHVGDMDAFSPESVESIKELVEAHNAEAVSCVHPALALAALSITNPKNDAASLVVGLFENEARPVEGGKPTFKANQLT